MKKWMALLAVVLLAGCTSGPPARMAVIEGPGSSQNSRLVSMPQAFIDEAGKGENAEVSQLAPWVEIDKKSGLAGYMGLTLTRVVADPEIFRTHAPSYLGVETNNELRVTVGGSNTVVLHAMGVSTRWHKNKVDSGGFRSTTYFEQVRYQGSASDMELLAKGPITRISASGAKAGTTWPRAEHVILPEYQSRFSTFYKENIVPAL